MRIGHLARRALTSFPNRPVGTDAIRAARAVLLDAEFVLWSSMPPRDQTHSLQVLRRFELIVPGASRAERAAALLHDVGKTKSNLGWTGRIVATIVGARGPRFTAYADHERIGASMLAGVSEPRTVQLVAMKVDDDVARALTHADNV